MTEWMTDNRRTALRAICDTVVPSIARTDDATGFWARKSTDVGTDQAIIGVLATMPAEQRDGLLGLVDVLGAQGIVHASPLSREQLLSRTALLGPMAAIGVGALTKLILFLTYGQPDPATGQNPMWKEFGYPGPVSMPPQKPKPISPVVPAGDVTINADVVVVGSGSGGGVIAGKLAGAGLKVVVLEAGGYFDESDFNQLELWAYQNIYWRGGPTLTADMNINIQAGATLGGGSTVNWTNCLRTRPWVREEWAREHGLEGVDGPDYDRHLDAVSQRIGVNDNCSELNGPNQRLKDGADKLGWAFRVLSRNADPATYDPVSAGYLGFGDQSGSKLGTMKTYLQDAFDAGADIIVRCRASKVLVEAGRAAGVEATYADPVTGATAKVTVRAPQIVVAGGSLESPALLLRSGIGGPAVGKNLRLHPVALIFGVYREKQDFVVGRTDDRHDRSVRAPRSRLRVPDPDAAIYNGDDGRVYSVHDGRFSQGGDEPLPQCLSLNRADAGPWPWPSGDRRQWRSRSDLFGHRRDRPRQFEKEHRGPDAHASCGRRASD